MNDQTKSSDTPAGAPAGATTTPTSSALGLVVGGRYRIVQPLAAGGMGSVYLAEQDNLRRRVAIKRVSQPDDESAVRFRREAEALAAVSHPAIVEIFDFVSEPKAQVCYLVMAYVAGENVADYVATRPAGALSTLEALELMLPVASALVELHAHEILHRDIKPANLVRYERADGRPAVKLVDFGIARRAQDPGLTAEGLIVGTPPYLSPEVILGKGHSEASDVFAFGATFFELLTGAPPHGRDDLHLILKRATQGDVLLPPGLQSTPIGALLLCTLAKEDGDRPKMQAVLEEMERIQLALLQESGARDAALLATRRAPSASLPLADLPGAPEASREAQTVALSQQKALLPAEAGPSTDGATAQVAGPAPDHTTDAVFAAPGAASTTRSSPVPWIVAGAAVALAIGVTLFFSLRGAPQTGRSDGEKTGSRATTTAADRETPEAMRATGSSRSRGAMRPSSGKRASTPDAKATDVARILARCNKNENTATRLYLQARGDRKVKQRRPRVKATFIALLQCSKSSNTQKSWSAYYLSHLHAADGECAEVDRRWKQYVTRAGKGRNLALPKPACTPKGK